MTKSVLALARTALGIACQALPAYSHPNSPKKFTQHQLFAILAVREFLHLDYRGAEQLLKDWSDLRRVLKLTAVPHYSALCYAHVRLLKKGASTGSWTRPSCWPAKSAG
jgi:hypothetical protein